MTVALQAHTAFCVSLEALTAFLRCGRHFIVLAMQVLHLCQRVGAQGVHHLQHPFYRIHHSASRDCVHHRRAHLLPAGRRGPPLVVAQLPLRRQHW